MLCSCSMPVYTGGDCEKSGSIEDSELSKLLKTSMFKSQLLLVAPHIYILLRISLTIDRDNSIPVRDVSEALIYM
jgi:hypothetical protein